MMTVDRLVVVKREEYELSSLCKERIDDSFAWITVCKSSDLKEIPILFKSSFLYNFIYAKWEEDFFDMEVCKNIDSKPFFTMDNVEDREKPLMMIIENLIKEENIIPREQLINFANENLARIYHKQNYKKKQDF